MTTPSIRFPFLPFSRLSRPFVISASLLLVLGVAPARGAESPTSTLVRLAPGGGQFRLVRVTAPDGTVRLEMTNLDGEGNRLGGELTEADRIRIWGKPAPAPVAQSAEEAEASAAPVIVNVYPQSGLEESEVLIGGGGIYPGLLTGFIRTDDDDRGRPGHRRHGRIPRGTYMSAADPHARAIDVKPFTRGTARQRNTKAFPKN